jgi:hypothetical protein
MESAGEEHAQAHQGRPPRERADGPGTNRRATIAQHSQADNCRHDR